MDDEHNGKGMSPPDSDEPHAPPGWRQALEAHLEHHLGPRVGIYHDQATPLVLYLFAPTEARPFYTVVTMGISARPMHTPADAEAYQRQELMLYLPPDWDLDLEAGGDAAQWPFHLLMFLGRSVHEHETFFAPGHTIPNGDPPEPFVTGTLLTTVLLLAPALETEPFNALVIGETPCRFLWVVPITDAECALRLKDGAGALIERLGAVDVPTVIDPSRACAVSGQRPA